MSFQFHSTTSKLRVEDLRGVSRGVGGADFDGMAVPGPANNPLAQDGIEHPIPAILG
jgi:hypothetical protein